MKKVLKKRTGFTLVELLIVIIIIGILAGAMLLVAGSGTDKAEATKIVSDLRSLKAAALMYYADNPYATVTSGDDGIDLLKKYIDRELDENSLLKADTNHWWVGRTNISEGAVKKLVDMKETGIYGTENEYPSSADVTENSKYIWMIAR